MRVQKTALWIVQRTCVLRKDDGIRIQRYELETHRLLLGRHSILRHIRRTSSSPKKGFQEMRDPEKQKVNQANKKV